MHTLRTIYTDRYKRLVGADNATCFGLSLVPRPRILDKVNGSGTLSPEIMGLLTQNYQKSGNSIRLLILDDQVVRMALPKELSKTVLA